jgi:hypothetical protein
MRLFLVIISVIGIAALCFAAGEEVGTKRFSDVPANHWAADSVQRLAEKDVLNGYPDSTFRGDRPVTRYELAVALAQFAEFIEAGRKPLVRSNPAVKSGSIRANCPVWATSSVNLLVDNMFLSADSPVITDGSKKVTGEDLAQALSSFGARIVELDVDDPGPETM